jgi:hypothetical protein
VALGEKEPNDWAAKASDSVQEFSFSSVRNMLKFLERIIRQSSLTLLAQCERII